MNPIAFVALIVAAVLEVYGDYLIRIGRKDAGCGAMVLGAILLAAYGFAVNWYWKGNFSALLGVYVAVFFVVSQIWGYAFEGDDIFAPLRLVGAFLIVAGGIAVHLSSQPPE